MRKKMADTALAKLTYEVLRGDFTGHPAYEFWEYRWTELLLRLGSEQRLLPEEFLEQDKITVLKDGDKFVGIHLIREYDRNEFKTAKYFAGYSREFFRELEHRGVRRVQALQYFLVDEEYSVGQTLINFGAIIASLSLRHQIENGLDASITIARADIPVVSLGKKLGFEEISFSTMHNVAVGLIACFEPKPYPKDDVNFWVDYYWKRRNEIWVGANTQDRRVA